MRKSRCWIGVAGILTVITATALYGQIPNYRVSHPGSVTPNEVTIALNPANPSNLAAGANLNYYYYSEDGGYTWLEGNLQSYLGVWGDPCVAFDGQGNLYYGHLSNPASGYWIDRIIIQKSEDGGKTWDAGKGLGLNYPRVQDKEWVHVDLTDSPYRNTIYVSWTEFDEYNNPNPDFHSRIRFSRSTDFGDSWSPALIISDREGDCLDGDNTMEGAVPAVGPNGEVYIAWSGLSKIWFDKSLDGGSTFGQDVEVTDQPGGWKFGVPGLQRCNGLPITVCDISDSPYRGTIYILFSDQRNGYQDTDIWLVKSVDQGVTWSQPARVNDDDSGRHQFFPWIVVDPVTGYLYVVFYDRRETTGDATDVFMAKSHDGGETWTNFRISESSFTPVINTFFGDYIDIDAYNGVVHPIWMRMDYYYMMSVWTAVYHDTVATGVVDPGVLVPAEYSLGPNYPNPFNAQTTIPFILKRQERVRVTIFNALGQRIEILADETFSAGEHTLRWNAGGYPSGLYFYRIQAGPFTSIRKCLLLR